MSPDPSKCVLITGGGTGIGAAITREFAANGWNCMILGRREEPLKVLADDLASGPGLVSWRATDITDPAEREAAYAACVERFGPPSALINNAGRSATDPLLTYSQEDWRAVMHTNVEAGFFFAQLAVPAMRDRGHGAIVNIGSVYGSLGINNDFYEGKLAWNDAENRGPVREFAYAASKGAVLQITRELATALGKWNITVNAVTPGMVKVDANPLGDAIEQRLVRATPLQRMGRPEDIAPTVHFLTTPGAAFITGAEIKVDGGWSVW
ncbi:SDR family NAD(P)-dependent oxidoreductase [Pararhizobium mangrovi]|uniref:SDR family oxidoreductase n=1 Tax=Pararhizobium mangrovi TaxID=2590452 RepID=A0A506U6M7_9HYPH|nr:SDR family oxidoreductase [Pararhizobium mangrovi]TPW27557.1 SDR family oxidoreductase [Pararhizobium mangrovi]